MNTSDEVNIGLILGVAAVLVPMSVARSTLRRELPFMLAGRGGADFLTAPVLTGRKLLLANSTNHILRKKRENYLWYPDSPHKEKTRNANFLYRTKFSLIEYYREKKKAR